MKQKNTNKAPEEMRKQLDKAVLRYKEALKQFKNKQKEKEPEQDLFKNRYYK